MLEGEDGPIPMIRCAEQMHHRIGPGTARNVVDTFRVHRECAGLHAWQHLPDRPSSERPLQQRRIPFLRLKQDRLPVRRFRRNQSRTAGDDRFGSTAPCRHTRDALAVAARVVHPLTVARPEREVLILRAEREPSRCSTLGVGDPDVRSGRLLSANRRRCVCHPATTLATPRGGSVRASAGVAQTRPPPPPTQRSCRSDRS